MATKPSELLDTLLGYLGFVTEIEEIETPAGLRLLVHTGEAERLIGHQGETMEHIQFLLNRLLQAEDMSAPKVTVDVEHYRAMREDELVSRAKHLAEGVRRTGLPVQLEPMNSYQRHLIHDAFKEDPDVLTVSTGEDARLKRITLRPRH